MFWFGAKHGNFDFPMQNLKVIRVLEVILNKPEEREECVLETDQAQQKNNNSNKGKGLLK